MRSKTRFLLVGVGVGVVYGIVARLILVVEPPGLLEEPGLVSLTYLLVVPAVMGAIPVLVVPKEHSRSHLTWLLVAWLTVLGFFTAAWWGGLEGALCIVVLATPFLSIAAVVVLLTVWLVKRFRLRREGRRNAALGLFFIPLALAPAEEAFESPEEIREIRSTVVVEATPAEVWRNVIRVAPISPEERHDGWLHYIGIPRPVEATLVGEGVGSIRTGRFEDGLQFTERVTVWRLERAIRFDIELNSETLRDRPFDEHVLSDDRAAVLSASYDIEPLPDGTTRLSLTSSYRLHTKLNAYAALWGDYIVRDFQDRLLAVVRDRLMAPR